MVRIGVLADVHYPVPSASEVMAALDDAFSWFEARGVEVVFVLGDLVQETGTRGTDVENLSALAGSFANRSQRVIPMMGNHDALAVEDRTFEDVFDVARRGTTTIGGVTCIRCHTPLRGAGEPHAGVLGSEQREFLLDAVQRADRAVVLSHHPLYYHDLSANPWFRTRPEHVFSLDRSRVEERLLGEPSGVLATLNGHTHQRDVTPGEHGVGVTLNPFSKHLPDDDSVYGAVATLDIQETGLRITERNVVSGSSEVVWTGGGESSYGPN